MRGSNSGYLHQRAETGAPIRIGLIGVGQMGAGIVSQCSHLPGIEIVALADVDVARTTRALARTGVSNPLLADDADAGSAGVSEGRTVITSDSELIPNLPVDVVIEATGVPEVGIRVGLAAAFAKKHLVSMNVEADVTVGRLLRRMFALAGKVYTIGAGDEPAVAWGLVDLCRTIGLEVVAAGKGKNNPLDFTATPSSVRAEALSKGMNPRMLAAFVDGTKTMCEMTALANATGLSLDVPGMHGPMIDTADLAGTFCPSEDGGILSQRGVVDYVTGDVAPGVFVVITTDDADVSSDLRYLSVGTGPYWTLTRPFHLANLELPVSIVEAVRGNRATLVPEHHMAELGATAKRDLAPGDLISGIGGEEVFGFAWPADQARERNLVPMGLAEGATVIKQVAQGSALTFDDVEIQETSVLARAWHMQEHLDSFGLEEVPWATLAS
ncbi:MAG: oxidoreductase [Actinomycetota bacterium]|nr:oxidoreductase [Actinomycetota bacterium]